MTLRLNGRIINMSRIKFTKKTAIAGTVIAGLAYVGYEHFSSTPQQDTFAAALKAEASTVAHHAGQKPDLSTFRAKKGSYSSASDARHETLHDAGIVLDGFNSEIAAAAGCILLSANDISWPKTAVTQYLKAERNSTDTSIANAAYDAANTACLNLIEIAPGQQRELLVLDGLVQK